MNKVLTKSNLLLVGIALLVTFVFFEALLRPASAWDAWASWLLKAKMFYVDGFISPAQLIYAQSEYPLALNVLIYVFYILIGNVDDRLVLVLYPIFYTGILFILYRMLRSEFSRQLALLGTFLFASLQNIIRHAGRYEAGQADLPLGFGMLASSVAVYRLRKNYSFYGLLLAQVMLAITSQIKNEGIPFTLILQIYLLYIVCKEKKYRHFPLFLIGLLPIIFWQWYKLEYHLPHNYLFYHTTFHLDRLLTVLWGMGREFFNLQNWNLLWIVFLISLYVRFFIRKSEFFFFSLVLLQLSIYAMIFLLTPLNTSAHIENVVDRLYIHIAPLALLAICQTLFPIIKKI